MGKKADALKVELAEINRRFDALVAFVDALAVRLGITYPPVVPFEPEEDWADEAARQFAEAVERGEAARQQFAGMERAAKRFAEMDAHAERVAANRRAMLPPTIERGDRVRLKDDIYPLLKCRYGVVTGFAGAPGGTYHVAFVRFDDGHGQNVHAVDLLRVAMEMTEKDVDVLGKIFDCISDGDADVIRVKELLLKIARQSRARIAFVDGMNSHVLPLLDLSDKADA